MDFARKQLEKYGWSEGQGLGREGNGIANPIKVKIKRDAGGVGLAPGEEFSHWWSDIFNRAAQNIAVTTGDDGVCIESKSGDDSSLSLKAKHYGNHRNSLLYGGFLDSACTYQKDTTACVKLNEDTVDLCQQSGDAAFKEEDSKSSTGEKSLNSLTDEDLLKACGGRTAHKAARHGLKLNGKLKRIQEQEQQATTSILCTVSEDKSEEAFARTSDKVRCKKQSRKRKRTRDGSVKKKKKLGA